MSASGDAIPIASASYTDPAKTEISHQPAGPAGAPVKIGETVNAAIDWDLRYARMRMHTALHLLSAVLPYPVTGGAGGGADGQPPVRHSATVTGKQEDTTQRADI